MSFIEAMNHSNKILEAKIDMVFYGILIGLSIIAISTIFTTIQNKYANHRKDAEVGK